MERLTIPEIDYSQIDVADNIRVALEAMPQPLETMLCRLAAYEDTGLSPKEVEVTKAALMGKSLAEIKELNGISIERIIELAKAEAENRLIVPPCKVGGEVYSLGCYIHSCAEIDKGTVFSVSIDKLAKLAYVRYESGLRYYHTWDEFGRIAFSTREEAEQALERSKNNDKH